MTRLISSRWTLLYKLLVPFILVSICIVLLVSLAADPSPSIDAFVVTTLTAAAAAFFCLWGVRLKRVEVDDHNLYVSNWIREILIPLSEIDSVEALYGGWRVMLVLKTKSRFGRRIFFLAKWQPFTYSPSGRVIEELRRIVELTKQDTTKIEDNR